MKYKTITGTDLKVSAVCLGCDHLELRDEQAALDMLDRFTDGGGTFFDTANLYGKWLPSGLNECEIILGKWLKSRGMADKAVIATKGAHYALGKMYVPRVNKAEVERDLDESLQTLGLDCIDFYWLHRDDLDKPIAEIIDFMEDFVKAGKIRYYGGSNYTVARMTEAAAYAKKAGVKGFCAVSNSWSPAMRNIPNSDTSIVTLDNGGAAELGKLGLMNIPFNSTARGYFQKRADGVLSEELHRLFDNDVTDAAYKKITTAAKEQDVSVQTALLRYMINLDAPTIPITSVSRPEQLEAVLAV